MFALDSSKQNLPLFRLFIYQISQTISPVYQKFRRLQLVEILTRLCKLCNMLAKPVLISAISGVTCDP